MLVSDMVIDRSISQRVHIRVPIVISAVQLCLKPFTEPPSHLLAFLLVEVLARLVGQARELVQL